MSMAPSSKRMQIGIRLFGGKSAVKQKAKLQEKVHTLFATIEAAEKQEENEQSGQELAELGEATTDTRCLKPRLGVG